MAYFFFDFRDAQKQHRRDLLSSLLFQLSARSDTCHHIFSRFYLDHDEGAQNPSDGALSKCLMDMLSAEGQPPTYIIIDALDESPNISGMPSAREKVLQFLEDLVSSQLPNVHICVSSRTEIDIWSILEPLAQFRVSLHEESGQMADISGYIKSVVHSDRNMRRWTADNKQRVIESLSEKADGMQVIPPLVSLVRRSINVAGSDGFTACWTSCADASPQASLVFWSTCQRRWMKHTNTHYVGSTK
jgi:hypothetical protein